MECFNCLPEEITLEILSRVPAESVLECKSVCKTWRNYLDHPSFSKMHFDRHLNQPCTAAHDSSGMLGFISLTENEKLFYFEYKNFESRTPIQRITRINFILPSTSLYILGSCNGLICLARLIQPYICNPITKEYLMLPEIDTDDDGCGTDDVDVYWTNGFGYVSSTDEYKVVRVVLKTEFVQVWIYTLGSGKGWRKLENFCFRSCQDWGQGIFSNGFLYWLDVGLGMIFTFDLAEEKFCEHLSPPPSPSDSRSWSNHEIGVLDGFLYLAVWLVVGGSRVSCYDIWVLKKKNDSHDTKEQKEGQSWVWSKQFRVDPSKLFAVTEIGHVLTYTHNSLNIYGPKASTSKSLVDSKEQIWDVFPHKNTLVSLKELGEVDTKIMESVEVETESLESDFEFRLSPPSSEFRRLFGLHCCC